MVKSWVSMEPKEFFVQNRGVFFPNRDAAAAYVRANCMDAFASAIQTADEAAAFENPVDWLRQPGDDPEFVYAFNRMAFWISMGQAYAVTADEKYAKAFAKQLVHWVNTVRRDDPACAQAWRTIEAGFRMAHWGKAMCYFEGSPYITEKVADKFTVSMTDHAEYIMESWDSFNLMSNWGIIASRGLFFAGCLLPETERTTAYRREALRRLNASLRIQVYPDGVQWEQSPMYHNEVLQCLLEVVLLAHRKNVPLPEGMETTVHHMAEVNLAWQKPDGREPMMGDSDDTDLRGIMTFAASVFQDGALKFAGHPKLDFNSLWMAGAEAAKDYEAMPRLYPAHTDFAMPDSGNYVLRSGWEKDGTWVRFHCGMLGAGHGHADQLHFDISALGEDVLTDSGRFTYVYGPQRREFKGPSAHNTATVDGEDFYVTKDSWECSKLCRAVNRVFYSDKRYGYAEGGHLGYYEKGIFVNRRLIFLKPNVLIVADEFYTGEPHVYRQFFHFGESGIVSESDGLIRWKGNAASAQMNLVSATPVTIALRPSRISRQYNHAADNIALETTVQGSGFTAVFTVLSLDRRGAEDPVTVEKLPVYSNFKGIQFEDRQIEALRVCKESREWVVVVAHEEYASPTDTFRAGNCTGFGGVVVFDESAHETEIGTVLSR